ncbi:alpha/beta hydrolase family protein [Bradyrhizobium oligotrophicum]|uniref:alpha/beta hydrolase family protein n=1 Tax=Bradyrhizobium TaxID=374 RepID=UPI003EB8C6C8
MADAGFVVAALNHPGDTWRDASRTDSLSVLVERPADIKRLIDYMLDGWPDAARIDAQRIGLYGFSFGGYTGLAVIGGHPDLRKGLPNCATSSLLACKQLENGEAPGQPVTSDPRVRAAVIVDPYPAFVFPEKNLKEVAVPCNCGVPILLRTAMACQDAVRQRSNKGFRDRIITSSQTPNTSLSLRPAHRRKRRVTRRLAPMRRASTVTIFINTFTLR